MEKRKTILKDAGVLLIAAILLLTAVFVFIPMTKVAKADTVVVWSENFKGATPPALPTKWVTNYPGQWYTSKTNYAGGTAPEAEFFFAPSSVSFFRMNTTKPINIGGFPTCYLDFKQYVNHYNGDYKLKVETSTAPGGPWTPIYIQQPNANYGPGGPVGGPISLAGYSSFYLSFTFEGDSWNINYWFIDDITIGFNSSKKWEQLPDKNGTGIDIMVNFDAWQFNRTLADDFLCNSTGPITDVHLWGSWLNDTKGNIAKIHLGIHADIPANNSPSRPGALLWQRDFYQGDFTETLYLNNAIYEWWWDPYTYTLYPNCDNNIWQLDINIPKNNSFNQLGTTSHPIVYWLAVSVDSYNGSFGWKTAKTHWNDDAVRYDRWSFDWYELQYPYGHPYANQSIDMAFRITTTPTTKCCFNVSIKGGFSYKVNITNICNQTVTNVPWKINITGGILGKIKKTVTGTLGSLPPFSTTKISGFIFGFGKIYITVIVDDCPPFKWSAFLKLIIIQDIQPIDSLNYEYCGCG
jgi:hypothetical protein